MDTASPSNLMKLTSRQEVAQQTMAFRFEKPASFTFTPGQFIELELVNPPESDAEGNSRVFSIASRPMKTSSWWQPVYGTRLSSAC